MTTAHQPTNTLQLRAIAAALWADVLAAHYRTPIYQRQPIERATSAGARALLVVALHELTQAAGTTSTLHNVVQALTNKPEITDSETDACVLVASAVDALDHDGGTDALDPQHPQARGRLLDLAAALDRWGTYAPRNTRQHRTPQHRITDATAAALTAVLDCLTQDVPDAARAQHALIELHFRRLNMPMPTRAWLPET